MNRMMVLILLVLVLGGGFVWWRNSKIPQPLTPVDTSTTELMQTPPSQEESFQGGLAAAVALGIPMKCTYAVNGETGEGYIQGKKFRASFQSAENETSEVVMKDNCMWTWSQDNQGITMCFDASEADKMLWNDADIDSNDAPNQVPDAAKAQFDCKPTLLTDDMFTPPANVKFTDLSAMFSPGASPDYSKLMQENQ